MLKDRIYIKEALTKKIGSEVVIAGFLDKINLLGKLAFLNVFDKTGKVQVFVSDSYKGFKDLSKLTAQSSLAIKGKIKESKKKDADKEIELTSLEVLNLAETPLPVDLVNKTTSLDKRLDYRFLDMRDEKTQSIFKIQNTIANAFRKHFYEKGFVEMQAPCVISAASEGGTDLFEVKYFEKKAYLAQSPQLYKQMLAGSMEKTVMITPVWRAEKHNTVRHINEIRQMDIEAAFHDQMDIMKQLEECVQDIVKEVIKNNKKELDYLNVKIKVPGAKYIHYKEAIELLRKDKINIKHGEDLSPEAEKKLCQLFPDNIVFVHSWPIELKPFYIMPNKDGEYSEGFDALYGGIEISSGGQRIHIPDLLIKRLKAKGLNPKNFESYVDSFRYGAPPHAGWSIGLERLTLILCGLDNIREATMFPRDRDRLTP